MAPQKAYLLLVLLVAGWCLLVLLPPFLSVSETYQASNILYTFFSKICHQDEGRSLSLFGYPLAVCTRCSMVYFGFFIGVLVAGLLQERKIHFIPWFLIVLLPMLVDVVLNTLGLHHSTFFMRTVTGSVFGIGTGVLLTPLLLEGLRASNSDIS